MAAVEIITPENLTEALTIKNVYRKAIVPFSAGTDIIVAQRNGKAHFQKLLNIYNLQALRYVHETPDSIEIGPCVTHAEIMENEKIRQYVPVLAEAASTLGCPQIRNRGTVGGNVCNASPAGDTIGPLYIRNARVRLTARDGQRTLPVREFITGPGKTAIGDNEIVTGFVVPKMEFTESFYLSLRQRKSIACNKVSLAFEAVTDPKKNEFKQIRLAFGAVAPTVVRAVKTEVMLTEQKFSTPLMDAAKEQVRKEVDPIDDIRSSAAYRREMCAVLLEKAIAQCFLALKR